MESTKKTKAAIVAEVTSGTPVMPSATSDYTALQDGFTMEPNFETLTSAELRGTIDAAEPILGLEAPTASMSHYIRHSGTEGVAPDWNLLPKSIWGAETVNSTERTTTTGSTAGSSTAAAIINLAAGGTDFSAISKGIAMLIKDATNGYSVRNATSVATNNVTVAFNLANAPATGVTCGKAVYYSNDASDAGKAVTLVNYLGDGGAIQMVAGAKVDSATINLPAGDFINGDFTFIGSSYYFNPIEISTANKIDFKVDGGSELTAALTAKVYRDPAELAAEVQSKMDALTVRTITCTYSSSTGKFTIASADATTLDLLWSTGTNTATTAGTKLGYVITSDDTSALSYLADNAQVWSAPQVGVLDSEGPLTAKGTELMVGSYADYGCLSNADVTINFSKSASDVMDACATSGKSDTLFNGREITVDVSSYVTRHDVSKWLAFKDNTTVQFAYTAGRKSGSNWVAGSVVNFFAPSMKVSSLTIEDSDGLLALNFTLSAFTNGTDNALVMNLL